MIMLVMLIMMTVAMVIMDHGSIDHDHGGNDDVDQDSFDFVLVFNSSPHIF